MKKCAAILGMMLIVGGSSFSQSRKSQQPPPSQLLLARRTYLDFGPPFNFYELFFIQALNGATRVERIRVTPAGDECTQPATVSVAVGRIEAPLAEVLGGANLCAIPEKNLHKELRLCKNCLAFSGADTLAQVQCGDQTRRIRTELLDKAFQSSHAMARERPGWTMTLLIRLDRAMGNPVGEQRLFPALDPARQSAAAQRADALLEDLARGRFDDLFEHAPDKPSALIREARTQVPAPSVELASTTAFRPVAYEPPDYPMLARLARVEGPVSFTFAIAADGSVANLQFVSGHPMLRKPVEASAATWRFPVEAAGEQVRDTVDFKMNCAPATR
jgi:hypothetical protein